MIFAGFFFAEQIQLCIWLVSLSLIHCVYVCIICESIGSVYLQECVCTVGIFIDFNDSMRESRARPINVAKIRHLGIAIGKNYG